MTLYAVVWYEQISPNPSHTSQKFPALCQISDSHARIMSYRFDVKGTAAEPIRPRSTRSCTRSYISQPFPNSRFETVITVLLCTLGATVFMAATVIVLCFALVLLRSFATDFPKAVGIVWPELCVVARWLGAVVTPWRATSAVREFWCSVGEEAFWTRVGEFTEAFTVMAILLTIPASGLFILCIRALHMIWDRQRRQYYRECGCGLPF
ncbi:hypothetical protein OF83DRAFT_451365 [Amylostereum chailletii]|nr:hypothetical protein OF83DRAFT_451365 [Amylostereum chailletii]